MRACEPAHLEERQASSRNAVSAKARQGASNDRLARAPQRERRLRGLCDAPRRRWLARRAARRSCRHQETAHRAQRALTIRSLLDEAPQQNPPTGAREHRTVLIGAIVAV